MRPGDPRDRASPDAPWPGRTARAVVRFQPLLLVELLRAALLMVTLVPLVALTASRMGNVALSRAAVADPERLERRALSHGAAGLGAVAIAELGGAVLSAVLFVAFVRAFYDGRAVAWPGLPRDVRTIAAVAAVYVLGSAAQIALTIFADSSSSVTAPLVLLLLVAFVLAFAFADIACITEGVGPARGIRQSLGLVRSQPRPVLSATFAVVVVQLLAAAAAAGLVEHARDVTVLFLPGWVVAQAVLAYVGDIVLLEVWRGRLRPPVSAGPAPAR